MTIQVDVKKVETGLYTGAGRRAIAGEATRLRLMAGRLADLAKN
jgi:hypothetical protein